MDPTLTARAQTILRSGSPAAALLDALLGYDGMIQNPDVRRQDRELIEAVLKAYYHRGYTAATSV